MWKIVRKSNFNKELFEEKFIDNIEALSRGQAEKIAEFLNDTLCEDYSEYIYEAVEAGYKLYNGYEELL